MNIGRLFQRNRQDAAAATEQEMTATAVLEVPPPQPVEVEIAANELAEYKKVAAEVGFRPSALVQAELEELLRENNIHVYDYDKVSAFLTQHFAGQEWGWRPLRDSDDGKLVSHGEGNGEIVRRTYRQAVPLPVLLTVKKIASAIPEVQFYVSDLVGSVNDQDPFLMVCAAGVNRYVVERWNEPGFRE